LLNENFATVWEAIADALGDHDVIVQGDRRVTWSEFEDRAARVAGALAERGVGPGDRVALIARNAPEFLEVLFAAYKLRAAPVAFNYRYGTHELLEVLADCKASAVFVHASYAKQLEPIREDLGGVNAWFGIDDGTTAPDWLVPYDTALATKPAARLERSGGDLFVQYTGGTTGQPKGVVWRHADISATAGIAAYMPLGIAPPETLEALVEIACERYEAGTPEVYLPCTPLMHGAALYGCFGYFQVAGRVVLLEGESFDGSEFARAVEREGVTRTLIVGDTVARQILAALDAASAAGRPHDVSSLAMLLSAGLTFGSDHKRRLQQHAPRMTIFDGLGSSEGGPFGLSITPPGTDPDETSWFLATPGTVVIDEETGEILPRGSERAGLIAYKGNLPVGYLDDEEKTAANFREIAGTRYIVAGDLARIDEDGRLFLLGRGNACINTGGEKVFPEEVERVLLEHESVEDCIVIGVPDAVYGSAITAVVSASPSASPDLATLAEHAKEHLAGYKQPRHLVVVDDVRRTPAGKQDYGWARKVAEQEIASR
jgi:acyl-CoA synthetase (AMP-forming)/AMP-acid ligase II